MDTMMEQAVERAIATMHARIGEPVTVDDMARAAMFSKFHFTRVFQRVTGLSPGRFLSAIRIQRAKHLLVSTNLSVVEISLLVGYNSVGTFSARFSMSVGMAPTVYRKLGGVATHLPEGTDQPSGQASATVRGVISARTEDHGGGLIFVGLFPRRLPEGVPSRSVVMNTPGFYQFTNVPPGTWYLLAHRLAEDSGEVYAERDAGTEPVAVGSKGPLVIGRSPAITTVDLTLKRTRSLDPPVLIAPLDTRRLSWQRDVRFAHPGRRVREAAAALGPAWHGPVPAEVG